MTVTGHATATVAGTIVADTTEWEEVEGNVYFPPSTVKIADYFHKTDLHTHCPWKGDASYYTIKVGDTELKDAAWYYPETFDKAKHIKGYVAFYKNKVNIKKD